MSRTHASRPTGRVASVAMDTERIDLLRDAYRHFNARDLDALLDLLTDDVEWPDVAGGTVLRDKGAIRAYWEGQLAVASPHVEPLDFLDAGADLVVAVDQRVTDHGGELLGPPAVVFHRYTFVDDRVRRMVVYPDRDTALAGEDQPPD